MGELTLNELEKALLSAAMLKKLHLQFRIHLPVPSKLRIYACVSTTLLRRMCSFLWIEFIKYQKKRRTMKEKTKPTRISSTSNVVEEEKRYN